jgi:hypothetical protein
MFSHDTLEVLHCLRSVTPRQLELRQADERALRAPRGRKLDDNALIVALGIGGGRRERRTPVERLHITRRAFRRRGQLSRNDRASFVTTALDDQPLRGKKCCVCDRAVRLLRHKRRDGRERE